MKTRGQYGKLIVVEKTPRQITGLLPVFARDRHNARDRENTMEENKQPMNGQDEEMEADLLTLTNEDGEEYTFEVIDDVEHNGVRYLAVVEYVEDEKELAEKDLQMVILRVGEDEEGEYMDVVEDDEELVEISAVFEKRLSEEYEIKQ